MAITFSKFDTKTHEIVLVATDEEGFQACVAIHSTKLGPALGALRIKAYNCVTDMVTSALQLSELASYRGAITGIGVGGGIVVINAAEWQEDFKSKYQEVMEYILENFGMDIMVIPDLNSNTEAMKDIYSSDVYSGFFDSLIFNSSYETAYGVLNSLRALSSFKGITGDAFTVNVEGLGKVGSEVARLCKLEGWDVCVTDLDKEKAMAFAGYHEIAYAAPEDIKFLEGVYCPCALGKTVDKEFVEESNAWAICGAADNQLSSIDIGISLAARGKLYIPDFVSNSGATICAGVYFTSANGVDNHANALEQRISFIQKQASALLLAQTTQVQTRNAQLIAMTVAKGVIDNVK